MPGSFHGEISEKSGEIFEKDLAPRRETNTVSPPFDERLPGRTADGNEGGDGGMLLVLSPKVFSEIFGKRIDGGLAEVFGEPLSLIGKLFEIYFVRLIGAPIKIQKLDTNYKVCAH